MTAVVGTVAAAPARTLDEAIAETFEPVANAIVSVVFFSVPVLGAELPLIVLWLVSAAGFFTVYLGFQNVRGFKHAINLVRGRYSRPEDAGEVSHFQALATAVSGTVGLGQHRRRRRRDHPRRARCDLLDDH